MSWYNTSMQNSSEKQNEQTKFVVLGLVGFGSVGKDTVARYLVEKYGYVHISSGDLIRKYVQDNNLGSLTRENLQKIANQLREQNGADYLTVLALEKFNELLKTGSKVFPGLIISGLRAIPEVTRLKEEGGKVVAVIAPVETRYEWAKKRAGVADQVSFDQFKEIEENEVKNNSETQQNVQAVLALADATIVNNGSRKDLYEAVDKVVLGI